MCRPSKDPDGRRDVICDSFAMVKAWHEDDAAAFSFLLANADLKSCCEFLAELCEHLAGRAAEDLDTEPADLSGRLGAWQLRGG